MNVHIVPSDAVSSLPFFEVVRYYACRLQSSISIEYNDFHSRVDESDQVRVDPVIGANALVKNNGEVLVTGWFLLLGALKNKIAIAGSSASS